MKRADSTVVLASCKDRIWSERWSGRVSLPSGSSRPGEPSFCSCCAESRRYWRGFRHCVAEAGEEPHLPICVGHCCWRQQPSSWMRTCSGQECSSGHEQKSHREWLSKPGNNVRCWVPSRGDWGGCRSNVIWHRTPVICESAAASREVSPSILHCPPWRTFRPRCYWVCCPPGLARGKGSCWLSVSEVEPPWQQLPIAGMARWSSRRSNLQ